MTGGQKIDAYLHTASVIAVSDQVYIGGMCRMDLMAVLLNAALGELYAHGAKLPDAREKESYGRGYEAGKRWQSVNPTTYAQDQPASTQTEDSNG